MKGSVFAVANSASFSVAAARCVASLGTWMSLGKLTWGKKLDQSIGGNVNIDISFNMFN